MNGIYCPIKNCKKHHENWSEETPPFEEEMNAIRHLRAKADDAHDLDEQEFKDLLGSQTSNEQEEEQEEAGDGGDPDGDDDQQETSTEQDEDEYQQQYQQSENEEDEGPEDADDDEDDTNDDDDDESGGISGLNVSRRTVAVAVAGLLVVGGIIYLARRSPGESDAPVEQDTSTATTTDTTSETASDESGASGLYD
jgi:hypothetical protein